MTQTNEEIEKLQQMLKENAQDWVWTDIECREQAKRVLDAKVVEGDSYCVPSISDLCELMADEIEMLRMQLNLAKTYSQRLGS